MSDWQQRVIQEFGHLHSRVKALTLFLLENRDISKEDLVLLSVQLAHMTNYREILEERIKRFKIR
tara:strand:+ start:1134 stop:1328 length:195 start_codon:yes stop_codon:yes gene_type:complete